MNSSTISHHSTAAGNVFPIAFSTDDNYAPYAGAAIQSLIQNANPRNEYRIYILYTSLSAQHIADLESLATETATVQCLNIAHLVQSVRTSLPTQGRITTATYYRILIPEIEAFRAYPCVIYLDCDLIVNTDIAGIVPQSMGDCLIAGAYDYGVMNDRQRDRLERDFQLDVDQYVNAGVLLINIPRWVQEGITQKCFDFLKNTSPEKLLLMDQDIINAVRRGRILYLDESWNYSWYWLYGDKKTVARCRPVTDRVGENFNILHFAAPVKPWSAFEYPHARYFWKYAGQTPFLHEIMKTNLCSKVELEKNAPYIRIGRAVTWLPRKIRGGVRCCRDHGVGYTLRRALYHLGLWRDEEAPRSHKTVRARGPARFRGCRAQIPWKGRQRKLDEIRLVDV